MMIIGLVTLMISAGWSLRPWPVVHRPGRSRYFNGWCLRFTEGNGASTSVIIGSFLGDCDETKASNASSLCAVLKRTEDGKLSSVQRLIADGVVMKKDHELLWKSPSLGYLRYRPEGLLEIQLDDIVNAHIDGRRGTLGANPEGWVGHRPFCWLLPCRYDIWTMASPAQINGREALGHAEFNCGKTFPRKWIWSQACDFETANSVICVGGSLLPILGTYNTWLVALRTCAGTDENNLLIFRTTDPGCKLIKPPTIDPEQGLVHLSVRNRSHRLDIEIAATPNSFFSDLLYVPTPNAAFEKGSTESFEATICVSVSKVLSSNAFDLLDTYLFSGAALEFGGGFLPSPYSTILPQR
mmetsp:Transcript_20798/g.26916  ORF Transcript_20798/g.26916 Transcript_20798/m.26916 type:complete len:354 (-) Transcript_20798:43-1104(-)|eukprot:CAMPEP_0197294596 /NCGR_PEP_ID=MMETSP0890-20130614/32987_1 /TAXON_ID=44058 ORGANISM="Aureoumbra lagunensis, Strain CCMP1510" /NCGR_SAMPLE_ID=MMETSP0890 /ASSEMBLY_ACC=CAM_ASM_000533 /LENGTH=353 /DNA_ID=CAMNT_0042770105 /DNA_START=221 /DNA_END=1282 /DNA_ORIENTATION=+